MPVNSKVHNECKLAKNSICFVQLHLCYQSVLILCICLMKINLHQSMSVVEMMHQCYQVNVEDDLMNVDNDLMNDDMVVEEEEAEAEAEAEAAPTLTRSKRKINIIYEKSIYKSRKKKRKVQA